MADSERQYRDRDEAGQVLAGYLAGYADREDVLILALPRGGVPVGRVVADHLNVPLDVLLVRKLGLPGQEELAIGAVASGGAEVLNTEIITALGLERELIDEIAQRQREELKRREVAYRGDRPSFDIRERVVIVVDDGLATGATMRAAISALKSQLPRAIVVAVPVAPPETVELLRSEVDEVVCPVQPTYFGGVSRWYERFPQVTDEQVRAALAG